MTFWTDARPATPRFRWRRTRLPAMGSFRPGRRGSGKRPGPRLIVGVLVATAVVGGAGWVIVRSGDGPAASAAAASRRHPNPSASPVIDASWSQTLRDYPQSLLRDARGIIVIGSSWVSEVDLPGGDSRWRAHTEPLNPQAALRGDTILLSTEPGFVALDRATGKQRWRTDTPETPGPVALVGPDGTAAIALVSTEQGGLVGLDSRTGKSRWSVRYRGFLEGVPAGDDTSGTVATLWRYGDASRLRVIDASTGTLRWEQELGLMSGSPIVVDGPGGRRRVVVGSGNGNYDSEVRAYDLSSGRLRWRAPMPASFQPDLVPLADGNALYVMDQLSHVSRFDLSTGRHRWTTDTGSIAIDGTPARAGSAILVTSLSDDVVTLDRTTGAIRARRRTAGVPIDLVVAHHLVLVAQRLVEQRHLQAFPEALMAGSARKPG